jgi:hypothetical protein
MACDTEGTTVSEVAAMVNSLRRAGVSREMRNASAVGMGGAPGPLSSSLREEHLRVGPHRKLFKDSKHPTDTNHTPKHIPLTRPCSPSAQRCQRQRSSPAPRRPKTKITALSISHLHLQSLAHARVLASAATARTAC